MEVSKFTEQDKELVRDLLRTVMTSVMWGDGIKREIADRHATDMALPLISKGILEGFLIDNTEDKSYEKYLNNLLDIKTGPSKKEAQDEAKDEAQEGAQYEAKEEVQKAEEAPKKKPSKKK